MGQGWRGYTQGNPPRWLGMAACLGGMFVLVTTGCRMSDCGLCRPGVADRKVSATSPPAIGLPGTPTLPPGQAATPASTTSFPKGTDSNLRSGMAPASPASAARQTPVPAGTASGDSTLLPTSTAPSRLPPPQDLSPPAGSPLPVVSPGPATSHWTPATPLSPALLGLQDPGPLPPPPPGATANMPVLPPTPPPGSHQ